LAAATETLILNLLIKISYINSKFRINVSVATAKHKAAFSNRQIQTVLSVHSK